MNENITSMFALIVYNVVNRRNHEWERQINAFIKAFNQEGVDVIPVDNTNAIFYVNKLAENIDFVFMWDRDTLLAETIEMMRIPVINSAKCIRTCSDRGLADLALQLHKVPTLKTIVPPYANGYGDYYYMPYIQRMFENKELRFPVVIKGRQIRRDEYFYLATNEVYLKRILVAEKKRPLVIQPYIPHKPGSSYRLYIVGKKYIVGAERVEPGIFNPFPNRGTTLKAVKKMPKKVIKIAKAAVKATGCLYAGVDVVRIGKKYYVSEVNPSMRTTLIQKLTKVDVNEAIAHACVKKFEDYRDKLRKNRE